MRSETGFPSPGLPKMKDVLPNKEEIAEELKDIRVREPWSKSLAGDLNKLVNDIAMEYWGGRILKSGKGRGKTPDPANSEKVKQKVKGLIRKVIKGQTITMFKTLSREELAVSMGILRRWRKWLTNKKNEQTMKEAGTWA